MDGSQWIDAFLSGELNEEQQAQFQAWLEESPEHVDQFATACLLENQLADIVGQQQLQKSVAEMDRTAFALTPATTPAARTSFWHGLVQDFAKEPVALAVLVLVMISGGVLFWNLSTLRQGEPRASARGGDAASRNALNSPVDPEPVRTAETPPGANAPGSLGAPSSIIVARLAGTKDAQWDEAARPRENELRTGQRLVLRRGFAEIAFQSGATVIVEGPAELEVGMRKAVRGRNEASVPTSNFQLPRSDNFCSLLRGKLAARVPQQAHGFTVRTPTHDIVDLGTEFAVSVDHASPIKHPVTEVQVFQGEVSVASSVEPMTQAPATQPQMLRAGQGVIVSSADAPRFITADPARFVRELPAEGIVGTNPTRERGAEPATEPGAGAEESGASARPLTPGDVLAVSRYALKLVKIDPQSGEQTLLVQGERGTHGTDWMCAAVDGRQRVLIGAGGLGLVPDRGGILRYDPQSGKLDMLAHEGLLSKGRVNSLAVASDGTVFASLDGPQDQIAQIDPESGEAKSVAPFGRDAWGLAMDADGRSLLAAAHSDGGHIARIHEGRVETWVKGGMVDGARGITVLPDGRVLVSVSYGEHSILEINRKTHRPTRLGTLPGEAGGILGMLAAESDRSLIVGMFLSDAGNVYRFDVSEGKFALLSSKGHLAHCGGVAVVPGGSAGKKGEQP